MNAQHLRRDGRREIRKRMLRVEIESANRRIPDIEERALIEREIRRRGRTKFDRWKLDATISPKVTVAAP